LGIADHIEQATTKRHRRNNKRKSAVVDETIVEEVNEDNADIAQFDDIDVEDTKDGVIGYA
jgi:hypothetical protein